MDDRCRPALGGPRMPADLRVPRASEMSAKDRAANLDTPGGQSVNGGLVAARLRDHSHPR